ncbi:iron-containing alcohol dehydrogenase family protein [Enterococcus innesii]|uniref:iron-containing alcohol dehydrogenase family protein n=1 Tax=Enterococcus innesii TaxID=2839759 RepID=UPI002DBB5C15|nr:iron-containing alcohol dehydrogenase family protein [Enterococcus innesii]MEB5918941.1 iron-containing alcohol dehydrogenase family protein [Enterococcus innesii]
MLTDLKVKVGPQVYRYHEGAIDYVPEVLKEYKVKRLLLVHGTVSWEKAKPKLLFLEDAHLEIFYHCYTGECSYYGAGLIADLVEELAIDFILGVGGGKLADLVGYAAHVVNRPFGLIPTLASNCAPWTPLSVMYKESGESEGKSEHYLRQAAFLITDPTLVIDAPVSYFIAGLADTLAKWIESEAILAQPHLKNEPFLQMAGYTAKLCETAILTQSKQAIEDMKRQEVTDAFCHLSEIVIAVAGMVGGLGDKYARNAAAHAMHDAISKYLPESHRFLHGEKVAYGMFYQLALEEKWTVIDQLIPFYQELHLPMSLHQMGIFPEDAQVIDQLVQFIDSKEKVHLIPVLITKECLKEAVLDLENYLKEV